MTDRHDAVVSGQHTCLVRAQLSRAVESWNHRSRVSVAPETESGDGAEVRAPATDWACPDRRLHGRKENGMAIDQVGQTVGTREPTVVAIPARHVA